MRKVVRRRTTRAHRLGLRVLFFQLVAWTSAAAAPAPGSETVLLLYAKNASEPTRQSLGRIRDELVADRHSVLWMETDELGEPQAALERTSGVTDLDAIVVLFGDPTTGQAELCVIQHAVGGSAVRRSTVTAADPEQMPALLAARALELLRATALELLLALKRKPSAQSPVIAKPSTPPSPARPQASPPPRDFGMSVELGAGLWKSIEGPPAAVVPVARLGLRLASWTRLRLGIAGLGGRPVVHSEYGSASLSQSMALLELAAEPRLSPRIHPLLSLGAGVLNVEVKGAGVAPYEGLSAKQWSVALDMGTGIAVDIGAHTALATELYAVWATPHPVVRFIDTKAATIGAPILMATLTLRAAL